MNRHFNFSAGPAVLPEEVLERAATDMLDWHGSGMSVMEMSHRGKEFVSIYEAAEADVRELLVVPQDFKILFMQGGGIVIFDTRDAANSKTGLDTTPETRALRMILAGMSVPDLEPLPPDHVLTKAFYLIDRIPGRYATGTTWIEATAPVTSGTQEPAQPVRAGDSVSPVLITGNDLAAAWATDRRGEPLFPLDQSMPRQRDMAFRAGVNIVMYALTGNYKADQVHVPALLERLGN